LHIEAIDSIDGYPRKKRYLKQWLVNQRELTQKNRFAERACVMRVP
jgi:hypothetical protein